MRLRLSRLSSARPAAGGGSRTVLARLAGVMGVVALLLGFAWPVLAGGQGEATATPVARQGQRGTPVPTATATVAVADATPGGAGATPMATPVAAGEAVDAPLLGVFSVGIGEADLPPGLPGAPALVGLWNLMLEPDGRYTIARQDVGVVASGGYSVSGETLTFEDWSGVVACGGPDGESGATYAWRLDEDVLTLTPISELCADRKLLLSTRTLGSFEACVTEPIVLPSGPPEAPGTTAEGEQAAPDVTLAIAVQGTPGAVPAATPIPSLAETEGVPAGADVEEAIDSLLRQATGCWATGDPGRFLPLHSQLVLADFVNFPTLAGDLQLFMATPVSFERIGDVQQVGPTSAWAYVEITFGGEAVPQRLDFVLENGTWLLNTFFLFGPTDPAAQPPAPPMP
jgi:hypothetical protein